MINKSYLLITLIISLLFITSCFPPPDPSDQDPECSPSVSCSEGFVCVDGFCEVDEYYCSSATQCSGSDKFCIADQCTATCLEGESCKYYFTQSQTPGIGVCSNNNCVPTIGSPCKTASDCSGSDICNNDNICVASGSGTGAGGGTQESCGDNICNGYERVSSCPNDCTYLTDRELPILGSGTTYFVSSNGDDSAIGTSTNNAWATIGKANQVLQAGDTVKILSGMYEGENNKIQPKNKGTQGNPITYMANEVGTVTIDTNNNNFAMNLSNTEYITVSGINIDSRRYIDFADSKYIIVQNGEFVNSDAHPTIVFRDTQYSTMKNNKIIGYDLGYQDLVEIYRKSHHNLIENNHFEQAFHLIIHMYGRDEVDRSDAPNHNIIKNNYFLNDYHTCVGSIQGADYNLFEGNFFEQCGWGIREYPYDPRAESDAAGDGGYAFQTPQSNGILRFNTARRNGGPVWEGSSSYYGNTYNAVIHNAVYHNTFYDNYEEVFGLGPHVRTDGITSGLEYGDNVFKNNIIFKNQQTPEYVDPTEDEFVIRYINYYPSSDKRLPYPQGDVWAGNLIESEGQEIIKYPYTGDPFTLEDVESETNGAFGGKILFYDNIQGDPNFNNPNAFDFTIPSNSIAKDSGVCLTEVKNSGTGTNVGVDDARYFIDGWGIVGGDEIMVGNDLVTVTNVNYNTNTLTVSSSISFTQDECVSFPYSGSKPDIGAFEYN